MTPEVEAECAAGETGGPHCLEAVAADGPGRLARDRLADGVRRPGPRPTIEQFIFFDEAWRAGAPIPFLTINTVGRTIMEFGTEEQKQRFLPAILRGELHFSIGYTEPSAGTDLASLRTTAVRDGDEWVINGQKIFTSLAELRRLHLARGPHRPRRAEAQGHHDLHGAHHGPRLLATRRSTRW